MIIQNITVDECTPQTIVIGRRGTYDTLQIAFDLGYLVESYGNGVAVLAVKRSQDTSAYPAVTSQADNILTWIVSDVDTYYVGSGECQLMWYVDGGLAKTIIYPMVVMRDILSTAEEPPDGYENWIEHLTELGAETQQNAQNAAQSASDASTAKDDAVTAKEAAEAAQEAAETAVTHYPVIINGYWNVWSVEAQSYVSTGIQAEGEDGYSPEVTITTITGGHRVTITDKDHPQGQSFDVLDGQGGGGNVNDVRVNNTSVLVDGIANVPVASANTYGVVKTGEFYGTKIVSGKLTINAASPGDIKEGETNYRPIAPLFADYAAFYGLARAAGDTSQALSPNTVGNYTDNAKTAIKNMLGVDAGGIAYDSTETYQAGTVGAELSNQSRHLSDLQPAATSADVGKALVVKTVVNGQPASYEYKDVSGLTVAQKNALLQCFAHVAWTDEHGQTYYDALEDALYPAQPTPEIQSISATFSGNAYENELFTAIEQSIVVEANYSDGTSASITGYAIVAPVVLSLGTNTVTITYETFTTTLSINAVQGNKSDMTMWTSGVPYTDLEIVDGEYYNRSHGTIAHDDTYSRTGYIPVYGAKRIDYTANMPTNSHYNNAFYDESKTPLSGSVGFTLRNKHSINVPDGAYYLGLSDVTEGYMNVLLAGTITPYDTAS